MSITLAYPLAISMWDFSWLERRWPGAGYESWDEALDGLKLRGYDAVRIDAYPHFLAADPRQTWELLPQWHTNDWGASSRCRVQVYPALIQFIEKCAERNIKVGLSTWFRQDLDNLRMKVASPRQHAEIWIATLDLVRSAGLLDHILYVDLCNEFPISLWAPFLYENESQPSLSLTDPHIAAWMQEAIKILKHAYPDIPACFSFTTDYDRCTEIDVSHFDLLELHLWMAQVSDFYQHIPYNYERFDFSGYDRLALKAETLYRQNPIRWQDALFTGIDQLAEWSRVVHKPLITTECWALVDYKDAPLLNWDWIMDLCALGVRRAVDSGRWIAIATSNFCGPQFVGMWREVAWHQRLTELIHNGQLPDKDSTF